MKLYFFWYILVGAYVNMIIQLDLKVRFQTTGERLLVGMVKLNSLDGFFLSSEILLWSFILSYVIHISLLWWPWAIRALIPVG